MGQTTLRLGGYASAHVTALSSTELTTSVPGNPVGTVDITLTAAGRSR
jgi:hypothetical protein